MRGRRYLVLHLPLLATDRIRQRESELSGRAIATWGTRGNRRLLMGVNAPGTTLRPGQALADAQAMHPDLLLRPADPSADMAFLERLALWALRFTPLAAGDPPDGLVLDVTGCTDLFGEEKALLARVGANLARGGIAAQAVIASVVDAAGALARAGYHGRVVPPGDETAAVAGLPLGALRLPRDCVAGLNRLGLQSIGEMARQPRAPLMRRFGRTLIDVLDAVTGGRIERETDHAEVPIMHLICRKLIDRSDLLQQLSVPDAHQAWIDATLGHADEVRRPECRPRRGRTYKDAAVSIYDMTSCIYELHSLHRL